MAVYPEEMDLDIAGAIEGTDKSSTASYGWGYLESYEPLFAPLRDRTFNFLEIGALGGSSLRLWRNFFYRATIIGVDINEACRKLADDRIIIEIGSQTDAAFVARIGAAYRPTVVIDDGSHQAGDIAFTFEHLFEFVQPGGIYVVEDVMFHVNEGSGFWNKSGAMPIDQYFIAIARSLMGRREVVFRASERLARIYPDIESVAFIGGVVLIHKRRARTASGPMLAAADRHLAAHGDAMAHERLAEYALKRAKDPAQALVQIDKALALNGARAEAYALKATILEADQQHRPAEEAVGRAVEIRKDDPALWTQRGRLQLLLGDTGGAIASLERSKALRANDAETTALLADAHRRRSQATQRSA